MIKKKTDWVLLCCLLLIIAFLVIKITYPKLSSEIIEPLQQEDSSLSESAGGYYRVFDTYDMEEMEGEYSFAQAMKEDDFLDRLKLLNGDLHAANDFTFFELADQPLYYLGRYDGAGDFVLGYDLDRSMKNQEIRINQNTVLMTPIYAVQIDGVAYDLFSLDEKIVQGRGFEETDFLQSEIIPCLVGEGYLSTLDIGDSQEMNYLDKTVTIEVIGVISGEATLVKTGAEGSLRNYIVMPLLSCNDPEYKQEEAFQIKLYDQKNWGYIIDEGQNYMIEVESLGEKYNLHYTARKIPNNQL